MSDQLFLFMVIQINQTKQPRRKSNKERYNEIHQKIYKLLTLSKDGLTRKQIMNKLGIKHRRTLHKHLFGDSKNNDSKKRIGFGSLIRVVNVDGKNLIFLEPNYQRLKIIKRLMDHFSFKLLESNINPESILNNYVYMFIPEKLENNKDIKLNSYFVPLEEMNKNPEKIWKDIQQALVTCRNLQVSG